MPSEPSLARQIAAWVVVVVTVLVTWKFVDYRNQPPPIPSLVAPSAPPP